MSKRIGVRAVFALIVFAALALTLTSRPKRLIDFDQWHYLTIAYDLTRHGVFSNGGLDDVDSTGALPPPGMFFAPLYPVFVAAVMRLDARFAAAVTCSVEANHQKRDPAACEVYTTPMLIVHALLLALAMLAIARTGELIAGHVGAFYLAGTLAAVGIAAEAELFSYLMTESLWFCLFSALMLTFVAALNTPRMRTFLFAGLVLGLLCLARPSFLVLLPTLLVLVAVRARWFSHERAQRWLRGSAMLAGAFLLCVLPWMGRNAVAVGKLGFTEEYGSVTLVERFAFNDMTAREFWLAFPYCIPTVGPALVERLFGADAMARLEWNRPGSFFAAGRARRNALIAAHGRLDPVIGALVRDEMSRNGWRHVATIFPLGWCGLWVGGLWSLFMVPLFAWACVAAVRYGKPLFLFYALPPLLLVGLHAAVANHYPRYNLGLIGPFSVGAAWVLARGRVLRKTSIVT
jgi:hypothetical protein